MRVPGNLRPETRAQIRAVCDAIDRVCVAAKKRRPPPKLVRLGRKGKGARVEVPCCMGAAAMGQCTCVVYSIHSDKLWELKRQLIEEIHAAAEPPELPSNVIPLRGRS